MDVTEDPDGSPAVDHHVAGNAVTGVEIIGVATLALAIVLDVISRVALHDQSMFRVASLLTAVAAGAAVFDAITTAGSFRRHPEAFWLHLIADIVAALLMVATLALRVHYWEADQGTPIRAIVPAVLALILIVVATWTNVTHRGSSSAAAEP